MRALILVWAGTIKKIEKDGLKPEGRTPVRFDRPSLPLPHRSAALKGTRGPWLFFRVRLLWRQVAADRNHGKSDLHFFNMPLGHRIH